MGALIFLYLVIRHTSKIGSVIKMVDLKRILYAILLYKTIGVVSHIIYLLDYRFRYLVTSSEEQLVLIKSSNK